MNPFISVCLIGKNEEKCIERCLKEIQKLALPVIYTDTGSTDHTMDIARQYTGFIHHFEWCNDFSKARNFCAMQAPTDWIWFLDCDEYVTKADLSQLSSFCCDENALLIGTIRQKDIYTLNGERSFTTTRLGRVYNRKHYWYSGNVHEQLTSRRPDISCHYFDLEISLDHDGYSNPDVLADKCRRNAELLLAALARKEDPYLYYQLGKCYSTLGKPELAADAFSKGLSFDLDPALFYVQSLVEAYGYCLLELRQYEAALSFEGIYDSFAVNADFVFLMGLIYMNNALFDRAIEEFKKAASFSSSVVDGVNSYRAFYNIGVIYECMGHTREAVLNYSKCNGYPPALRRLEVLTGG